MSDMITFRVPEEMVDEVDAAADAVDSSRSEYVRDAVTQRLDEQQQAHSRALEAARRALYITGAMFVFVVLALDAAGVGVIAGGVTILASMLGLELLVLRQESHLAGGVGRVLSMSSRQ
jgi:Arc/MetJ-type ribon-helix-helix transcriptional regulator